MIEHHVAYYSAKNEDKIISAERPSEILKNSIVTPSLLAAVLNFKYVNAMPLYRLEQEFKRNDIHISRQTMSSWVIKSSERYLSLLYDRMHQQIYQGPVIHVSHKNSTKFSCFTSLHEKPGIINFFKIKHKRYRYFVKMLEKLTKNCCEI